MAEFNEDVLVTVGALMDFGVLSQEGCRKFAEFIRSIKALSGTGTGGIGERQPVPASMVTPASAKAPAVYSLSALDRMQEFEPGSKVQDAMEGNGHPRRRARRGSFNPTKDELAKLREQYTAREIGEKFGVSAMTVATRARQLGLTTPREGGKKGGRPKKAK